MIATMFKAKFLITVAVIAGIHQFYADDDKDLATNAAPAASCAAYAAAPQGSNGFAANATGAQVRNCADAHIGLPASNG